MPDIDQLLRQKEQAVKQIEQDLERLRHEQEAKSQEKQRIEAKIQLLRQAVELVTAAENEGDAVLMPNLTPATTLLEATRMQPKAGPTAVDETGPRPVPERKRFP